MQFTLEFTNIESVPDFKESGISKEIHSNEFPGLKKCNLPWSSQTLSVKRKANRKVSLSVTVASLYADQHDQATWNNSDAWIEFINEWHERVGVSCERLH